MNQLTFLPTATASLRAITGPICRSALIEDELRWDLRRQWGPGPAIGWVGLNPSTADSEVDDPTIRREMLFSNSWGYGSMIKLNVYPFRSPHPEAMRQWRAAKDSQQAFDRNIRECVAALVECKTIVAAWGAGAEPKDIMHFLTEIDRRMGARTWMCIGTTSDGSPIHPLARGKNRVPDTATLQVWRDAE